MMHEFGEERGSRDLEELKKCREFFLLQLQQAVDGCGLALDKSTAARAAAQYYAWSTSSWEWDEKVWP